MSFDYIKVLLKKSFRSLFQLLRPQLPLFCSILLIQSIQLFISYRFVEHVGIGLIMGTIAWAYILTIPQNIIKSRIVRIIYTAVILVVCSLLGIIELFCAVKLEEMVRITHIAIIANTNYGESVEFVSHFVDFKFTLIAAIIAVLAIVIYKVMKRVKSKVVSVTLTTISLCSFIVTMYFGTWPECGVGRALDEMITYYDITCYNLKKSQPEFEVFEATPLHPDIILIIGESFDKNHSNLYGYDKETNPLLSKREKDGSLVVFSSVKSPAPTTNEALSQILSLPDHQKNKDWYENPMLPTALSKSGYQTYWISNQCATGLYDRTLSEIALLCDSAVFTTDDYQNIYDDALFSPLMEYVGTSSDANPKFCVVHLMGSHYRFNLRYPENYTKFEEDDYLNQKAERRETFATYDNSILFNDYVVDSMMNMVDSLDAVVIYLSDHGLDFYYTQNQASHGRHSIPESFDAGCQIPFMIYFTKPFREKYPEIVERTSLGSDREFNTKYLMNTIMDIAGYDIPESSIYKNSLFEGKFGESACFNKINLIDNSPTY